MPSWISLLIVGNDANHETGAFARHIIAKSDITVNIPKHVSFEAAASIGVGFQTAGYALHNVLGVPLPNTDHSTPGHSVGDWVLIYGGSTATGSLAIQFAKLLVHLLMCSLKSVSPTMHLIYNHC